MRIAVTGSSGFVGSALVAHLRRDGCCVIPVTRERVLGACQWDPGTGAFDAAALGPIDAFVHLAGESLVRGRWTKAKQQAIRNSRGPATARLCQQLANLRQPPSVFLCASGVGIYGDCGEQVLDETSPIGCGFLAQVAAEWEQACAPLAAIGTRTVPLRIAMVLDPTGGALARLLPIFRLGLGGRLGTGRQWLSWISLADLIAAMGFVLRHPGLAGPILAAAPQPMPQGEFTRVLANMLRRPAILPVPAFALRCLFGAMARELLLSSQRCMPRALLAAGFAFADGDLESFLRRCDCQLLARKPRM